jgi:hypothetical protein
MIPHNDKMMLKLFRKLFQQGTRRVGVGSTPDASLAVVTHGRVLLMRRTVIIPHGVWLQQRT